MLINFVDATNDANHYTKPPPDVESRWLCMVLVAVVCASDDDDEDTMQVDWEWGTVRYKMSNFNPPVRPPSASVLPSREPAAAQRTAYVSSGRPAAGGAGRSEPINGVTKPNKQLLQPVSGLKTLLFSFY